MVEVGLVRFRYGNNRHWDRLKIIRASEIEKKLVLTNLLHCLVDDSCYSY